VCRNLASKCLKREKLTIRFRSGHTEFFGGHTEFFGGHTVGQTITLEFSLEFRISWRRREGK
jgi:hypothetical protein